ncbi:hypothetical protein [Streptomyces sp. NBC_01750]|uniref:hypothetical protein n=1 Tax=Streptomyces sp. NBC_01750 TaxID=2975928 RepID=UPI002DDAF4A5|nr:hypothetical protein [Streptomyces sp. NBC_01750]WSD38174.1 hypothetical protein OG966_40490 [Streptomyces sp. NBC_01750]
MTTTIVNRRGGACTACATYVPPGKGTCTKAPDGWTLRCPEHPATAADAVVGTLRQRLAEDDEQPPAEVRYTGTPAQVTALVEALKLASRIRVMSVSEPYERREEPGRISVHVRASIDARLLAAIEREEATG